MKCHAGVVGRTDVPPERCVVLDHVRLSGADYSDRELVQLCVIGSRLEGCRFERIRMLKTHASLGAGTEQSEYIECSFDGAAMYINPGGLSRFVRCSFRNIDIRKWLCPTTELIDCTLSGKLRNAMFSGSVPESRRGLLGRDRNEFRGNDFSGMDLMLVEFRGGIDLTQQILPSGKQYVYLPDAAASLAGARSAIANWNSREDVRLSALRLIDGWLDEVTNGGQRQLLLKQDDYCELPGEAVEKVFSLIRPN